jgi:hypothetical protein
MGEIVNLRRARKQRARQEKSARADANRAKFGRPKAEKSRNTDDAARHENELDGKRLDEETD